MLGTKLREPYLLLKPWLSTPFLSQLRKFNHKLVWVRDMDISWIIDLWKKCHFLKRRLYVWRIMTAVISCHSEAIPYQSNFITSAGLWSWVNLRARLFKTRAKLFSPSNAGTYRLFPNVRICLNSFPESLFSSCPQNLSAAFLVPLCAVWLVRWIISWHLQYFKVGKNIRI